MKTSPKRLESVLFCFATVFACVANGEDGVTYSTDLLTRYVHVTYRVPADAPDVVVALCTWSFAGQNAWQPAKVTPFVSETALALTPAETYRTWLWEGRVVERRAAGLERTLVFNPYPDAQVDGRVDVDFRVVVQQEEGTALAQYVTRIQADDSDVFCVEDWRKVLQDAVTQDGQAEPGKWRFRSDAPVSDGMSQGTALFGEGGVALPMLTYPLSLDGAYAVFVHAPQGIGLRFTGDERTDRVATSPAGRETLWRWARMDRQHLVLRQLHDYTGWTLSGIDYVRFVPISDAQYRELEEQFGAPDKFVVGYWEPYSWAFYEEVRSPLQHREPLSAFAECRIGLADTQIGRFGMKVVYESRATDQLFYSTIGDPIGTIAQPRTDNVGRMQQFTNTLDATIRYGQELGLGVHANFGASNCYPGTPLQGDFSKEHPDWMRGSALRFEVPQVMDYVLKLYREALEIGAPGISVDFCRYPETVDTVETGNAAMRALRELAHEYQERRGAPVPILVRFPGTGVRRCELFDYVTWVCEGCVDYLCPSNIQGRHLHIDIAPYLDAVKGSPCQLLPSLDGLSWGLPMPGPFLWRVAQVYDAGVPGIHVYQADGRILGTPEERRCMRLLASSEGVRRWWEEDTRLRPARSKGVYLRPPDYPHEGYNVWERSRIWVEGVTQGELEVRLDGTQVGRFDGPPYLVGDETYASDRVVPPGEHDLSIRVRDGDGWLEQTFRIKGAG